MARTKDKSNDERDRRICLYRRNGFTYTEIADLENLTRTRVAQIVAEKNGELEEDAGRAEIASLLEFAERKCVELINKPGGVPGPNGRLVCDEDGEPVQNNGIVVDALKTLMVVEDRKAKLYGWEKQQKPKKTLEEYQADMWASVAAIRAQHELGAAERRELEELRQLRSGMVPGEVVREIEPPGQPAA